MAGILIENRGLLREILKLLGAEAWDCNWLLTGLEVVDWENGRDWEEPVLLSNRELLRDAERVQFIWGILSAIPAFYTKEQILAEKLPAFEIDENGESNYLADRLSPQHSLAFLEIMSEDSTTVTVVADDMEPLRPLFGLPEWTEDAERNNRRWHEAEKKAQALLEAHGLSRWEYRSCSCVSQKIRNDRIAGIWRKLYHHQPDRPIRGEDIHAEILHILKREREDHHG